MSETGFLAETLHQNEHLSSKTRFLAGLIEKAAKSQFQATFAVRQGFSTPGGFGCFEDVLEVVEFPEKCYIK